MKVLTDDQGPLAGLPVRPVQPAPSPPHARRWLAPLMAAAVVAMLIPGYRFGVGLDGLSYLSIAQGWASGDWSAAINPYWGPLYSWLTVPFLWLGISPLLAARLVAVPVAAGALIAAQRVMVVAGASPAAGALTSLALVPLVVAAAHYGIFADLLLSALLLALCADLVDPALPSSRRLQLRAGVLIALAYMTKLYGLAFAAAFLPLAVAWHMWRSPRHRRGAVGRGAGVILAVAAAVAGPWVLTLSVAEGELTVGQAGMYNVALVAPESQGNPIGYAGLLEPPREGAFSVWEEPSAMPVASRSWTESAPAALTRLKTNMTRNLVWGWGYLMGRGAGVVVLAGVAMVALVALRRDLLPGPLLALGAAAAVYAGGYLPLWVEERYAWFLLLLLAVPVALLVDMADERHARGGALVAVLLVLGLTPQAVHDLAGSWNNGRELDGIVDELHRRDLITPGQRVASAPSGLPYQPDWERSAVLCFLLDCQYLGHPAADHEAGRRAELAGAGVDRFLVWPDSMLVPEGLERLSRSGELGGLRVYRTAQDGSTQP